ncbi:DNA primase [Ileibacterium valens]|uniref:DNA primase n=1 Tax=Ileibacterium valens TaxID=1862668 RepID=UPI00259B7806|nr:DNA primase [Ileibacterium valens]
MVMIPQRDIDAIRSQADIVDVISSYLPVEKKGKDYRCICPFHDDHAPSMRISVDKQIYKCFACGAGGNLFTFVQKMEKISFPESVIQVAKMIGYPLYVDQNQFVPKASPFDPLYKVLKTYFDYTIYELGSQEGQAAMQYLKSRKFTPELIEKFQIGYAPSSRMQAQYMTLKKLPVNALRDAGLIRPGNDYGSQSELIPFFYNRITIPIHDDRGNPIGITARCLPSDQGSDVPKYINTTQTPIYNKGNLLFNYHRAREAARKNHRLVIVEGAMDVIGLAKAGIDEGVAALGTAFTHEQMQLIRRLNVLVTVFYDSDPAGQKAAWKFGNAALEAGISFTIVHQSSGKDPDELFISYGAKAVHKAIEKTIPFVEFAMNYLQSEYRLENYEDKKKYAEIIAELIQKTMNIHEAPAYYQKLFDLTGFDFTNTQDTQKQRRDFLRFNGRGKKNTKQRIVLPEVPAVENGRFKAEKAALCCMLASEQFAQTFRDEIGYFSDERAQTLSLYIYRMYREDQPSPDHLMAEIEEDEVRNLLVDLIAEDPVISEEYFHDCLLKIQEAMITDQIEQLNHEIQSHPDEKHRMEMVMKKQELIIRKLELRTKKESQEWKL